MNKNRTTLTGWLAASATIIALMPAISSAAAPEAGMPPPPMPMMQGDHGPHGPQGMPGMGPGHMHGGEPGDMHKPPFLHGLNLDEAQKDKIFAIMHAQAPAMRQAGKNAHKAHAELHQLTMSGKFDEARAKALAEASGRAMSEMLLLRARGEAQVYAVLTDEQRKKIDMMRAKAHGQHEHRMGQ